MTEVIATGEVEVAIEISQNVLDGRAGPVLFIANLLTTAAIHALSGDVDRARRAAAEGLLVARNEGFTPQLVYYLFIVAALAVRQSEIETATTLLADAAHLADPLDITGYGLYRSCRDESQAAVAAHEGDIGVVRRRGVEMTLDDLVNCTLDTLATP